MMPLTKNGRDSNATPTFACTLASRHVVPRVIRWLADATHALHPVCVNQFPSGSVELLASLRGALTCLARALREVPAGQPVRTTVAVVLGNAVAGGVVGLIAAHLRRTLPNECVNNMEGMMTMAMTLFAASATRTLRERAARFRQSAEAGEGRGRSARYWHVSLEWLAHVLVGVVEGISKDQG